MALPNNSINVGAAPLLWSDVSEAFEKINENFTALDLATGGSAVDLSTLNTDVSPAEDNTYLLGAPGNAWKAVITSEWSSSPGSEGNGVILGTAQIKGIGGTVDLPANSTVNGSLIIDPNKTFFKSVQVDNGNQIVADNFVDTLNLLSGSAIQMTVSSGAESITITNTGVTSAVAGDGISVSAATGGITFTNTGVRSLTNSGAIGTRTPGSGIHVSSSTGTPLLTNTGVLEIQPGSGSLAVSTDAITGIVTITNTAPAQPAFQQIEVNGDSASRLVADSTSGIFRIVSGAGITLAKTVGTDTMSITVNPVFDLKGSVFGDDSSILVDAVGNYIYGNVSATTLRTAESKIALGSATAVTAQGSRAIAIGQSSGQTTQGDDTVAIGQYAGNEIQGNNAIAIGNTAGYTNQGSIAVAIGQNAGETGQGSAGVAIGYYAGKTSQETGAVAIGYTTAQITQRTGAVAIGWSAGQTNQGAYSIALGYRAGFTNQNASSIVLNASGVALEAAAAGFFVNPIRSSGNGRPLMYDTATSELFSSSVLEFIGSTLSTSDSSAIQFDSPVTFQTSITVDGNITLKDNLILEKRLAIAELEGVGNELNIYSDWAKDTGVSIYSETGLESVTLTSDRIVAVVTNVGPSQKQWIFDTNGQIQFPDTRYQTGAAISITDLKVLVAACADFAAFKTAIAALA
jgi:hypothetical protein